MTLKVGFVVAVSIVAVVGGLAIRPAAQVPAGAAFEVASIKPHNAGSAGGRSTTMGTQPGRYTATNVTLRALIVNAYGLQNVQLSGGPGWMGSEHFDILAKIPAGDPH